MLIDILLDIKNLTSPDGAKCLVRLVLNDANLKIISL